jgi:hypothetical protein
MTGVLTLKTLTFGVVGVLTITVFALSLVSLRKEYRSGQSLTGLFPLALIIAIFGILIVLLTASA